MCSNKKIVSKAQIVKNQIIAPDTYALILRLEKIKLAEYVQPGQFIELNLHQPDLVLPRPLSVYVCAADSVEVRYQIRGEGTKRLSQMCVGTELSAFGPLGKSWTVPEDAKSALLIGGGIGSAPLAMLAQELVGAGIGVTMMQAARSAELLIACDFFEDVCCLHKIATDDGSRGYQGLITEPLKQLLADEASVFDVAYICGPEAMQEACVRICHAAELLTYVSLERMMACGAGACLTCVVPTTKGLQRVCADGPIFDAKEVDWNEARSSRIH